ncbi:C39 family peptidase [Pararobbsia alpina]|uniref:Peptidase C39 domain-containing protein n=1 Tax=Pararobbsia alpina TaxID=621374 RepID=A0A6S7B4A9_9BURK|nr:C39 family peptidase [Pararobbsia alpina]CAB3787268.1 hypothetical protein LMG28138_02407 [Pararobbsia alpina]
MFNSSSRYLRALACALAVVPMLAGADSITIQNPSGGQEVVRVTSLKEARFRGTVRQQYDFSCGSAAVATLLTYQYGYPMSEQVAFQEMFAEGDQPKIRQEGFSLLDMKRFLAAHGFDADGFEAPLEKLEQAQLPAIALVSENGYHHFVVIKGMRDGRVLVGDPALGTRALPRDSFEARWDNNVLFVIHNRKNNARFNNPGDWRYAPEGPRWLAVQREGLQNVTNSKFGINDF